MIKLFTSLGGFFYIKNMSNQKKLASRFYKFTSVFSVIQEQDLQSQRSHGGNDRVSLL